MLPSLAVQVADQFGAFTYAQALTAGYQPSEVRSRVRSGSWVRLVHGGYAPADLLTDDAATHRARAAAAVLTGAGQAVSHRSAAVLWGMSRIGSDRGPVHVLRTSGGTGATGVRLHRLSPPPDELTRLGQTPVTTPIRTVLDVADSEPFREAVVIADSALALGLVSPADREGRRGSTGVRRVLSFADGRAENPGESLSRVGIHAAGLPAPELQVELVPPGGPERGIRVDFLWRAARLVGEFDGRTKYRDRDDLWREKVREDRIRAMGYRVIRWSWQEAFEDFAPVARAIRSALASVA